MDENDVYRTGQDNQHLLSQINLLLEFGKREEREKEKKKVSKRRRKETQEE